MNIRELILESDKILEKIDKENEALEIDFICKNLKIELNELLEYFEIENIFIKKQKNAKISTDLLRQILFKEPEVSSPPNDIRELILNSPFLMAKINNNVKSIRVNKVCRNLGIGVKKLAELLLTEGIEIKSRPTYKIDLSILKKIIEPRKIIEKENKSTILLELENKINQTDENDYVKSVVLNQFVRSEKIREYAKIRANGICELCENPAPFDDKYGKPFLETHHIIYLSKGGSDSIDNVAAICPNCHRKIHNLSLSYDVDKLLKKRR